MYSQPGIRARGYAQSSPPRPRFFRITGHPLCGGLDPPIMGGHTVELYRNSRVPQHVDPRPDRGGAHAVCPNTQTIRRGHPYPLLGKIAGGIRPHR